jgi:hypothetical protein
MDLQVDQLEEIFGYLEHFELHFLQHHFAVLLCMHLLPFVD